MGLGANPPKLYKIIFKFLSFVKILIEISSCFNFPNWFGGGTKPIGGGPWLPGPNGSYGPDYSYFNFYYVN